eukprot:COSAG02_NODE_7770_length_2855_cov_2.472787_2_plen_448_part_00
MRGAALLGMLGLFHKETEEEKRQKRLAKLGDRLVRAAEQGDEAEMQECLEEGAAAAYVDRYGFNALMHAAKEGHVAASRLLLQSSAEVNAAHAEDGATALHLAACGGETACLGLLLEAGADCALCMKDGSTAPMLAAMVGLESALRIFSAHGVDLKPLRGMEGLSEGVRELLDEQQAERQPSAPGDASAATLPVVSLEVEDGSAGFTCEKGGLSVIRLDEGGAAAAAGVVVGMRCVAFQSAALPDGMTWAELKARVKAAPKPWRFRFAAVEVPTGPPVLLDDGGTASWATSTEAAGAGSEFTAHESISRGIALAQVADLSRVTDAQLEEYRAALRAELSRADAERASRDAAAVAEAAAESASASRVGDAMAQLGHPIAQYASLFASLSITVELMEALGDDEENWSELFGEGCDLEAVNPSDRAALVAAVPAIAAAASIGGGDNTTDC